MLKAVGMTAGLIVASFLVAISVINPLGTVSADAASCYQSVRFYNGAGVVVSKFGLEDTSGEIWISPDSHGVGGSVTIDMSLLGIEEGATVTPFYSVAGGVPGNKGYGRSFSFCVNGVTAAEDLYGTAFSLYFEPGSDIYQ